MGIGAADLALRPDRFQLRPDHQATGQYNNTWHFSDSFSKIWKKHTFKFGGDFRYLQINERNVYAPNGNFNFDGSETGHDVADFLLGAPDSVHPGVVPGAGFAHPVRRRLRAGLLARGVRTSR